MAEIGRASAALASGTLVSRILGFAKIWLLVQAIGVVSLAANAYQTATIVPNSIYAIIAQGILNAVLIPQIVRASYNPDGGKAYINKFITLGIVIFAAIALVATALAPVLVRLYGVSGTQAELATTFAYWSLPQIFFFGLYSLLGEVLNARRSFGPFTWAPVLNNIVAIAVLVLFIAIYGTHSASNPHHHWTLGMVVLLAGGATAGVAAQALILFLFWRRLGLRFRFDFRWRGVNLGSAGIAASWTFAMLLATQLAGLVETVVANSGGPGYAGSFVMSNAWTVFMLPHGIIAVSIVTAYYTRMAEHVEEKRITDFRSDFSRAVRSIMLFIVISSVALIVLAYPVARIFTESYHVMGNVLAAYAIGLVPFSLVFLAQRAFYALGDTKTPFYFTLAQTILVVALVLPCFAIAPELRAATIALIISASSVFQAILAFVLLRRKIGSVDGRKIVDGLWKFLTAGVAAAIAGLGILVLLGGVSKGAFSVQDGLRAIASCAIVGVAMIVVYAGVLLILRSPELANLLPRSRKTTEL